MNNLHYENKFQNKTVKPVKRNGAEGRLRIFLDIHFTQYRKSIGSDNVYFIQPKFLNHLRIRMNRLSDYLIHSVSQLFQNHSLHLY